MFENFKKKRELKKAQEAENNKKLKFEKCFEETGKRIDLEYYDSGIGEMYEVSQELLDDIETFLSIDNHRAIEQMVNDFEGVYSHNGKQVTMRYGERTRIVVTITILDKDATNVRVECFNFHSGDLSIKQKNFIFNVYPSIEYQFEHLPRKGELPDDYRLDLYG